MVKEHYITIKTIHLYFVFSVALGSRDSCPRHRGLPDGFKRGENKIKDRALFRIDLRRALGGYEPNKVYKCKKLM